MSKNKIIMLPRDVVELALNAFVKLQADDDVGLASWDFAEAGNACFALRAALEQPQPAPYLYYDPANGDTWTQEAINDGCCLPDGLIALYTNDKK